MTLPSMFGYIDPVSGSIILQVIVGGLVGGVVLFRDLLWRIIQKIVKFSSRK